MDDDGLNIDLLNMLMDADPGGEVAGGAVADDMLATDIVDLDAQPRGRAAAAPGPAIHGGGAAAAASSSWAAAPAVGSRLPLRRVKGNAAPFLPEDAPDDLPLCAEHLIPEDVRPLPFVMIARFNLKIEVDLKMVAFGVRHAEYNPRKHGSITIRLVNPRCTCLLRASGVCSITGSTTDEQVLKHSAKKVARLVQRCGHQQAKFAEWSVVSLLCKVDLGHPVRLDSLTSRWRQFAVYEPEVYSGCIFKLRKPRWTYNITAGGKVMISGTRTVDEATDALRRIYPILGEFQH